MKKIIVGIATLAFILSATGMAYADTTPVQCDPSMGHVIYAADGITVTGCIDNTTWNANLAKNIAANTLKLPVIVPGAIVTDEGGFSTTCPPWFSFNCLDMTHTDAYRSSMMSVGSQLKALGQTGGIFGYWISKAQ